MTDFEWVLLFLIWIIPALKVSEYNVILGILSLYAGMSGSYLFLRLLARW